MEKIIKLSLILFIMICVTQVKAQLSYGVKGGLNFTNFSFKFSKQADEPDTQLKPGFHLGAVVSYPLTEMFNIESGLMLSTKGFNYNHEDEIGAGATVSGFDRSTITYLVLPVHITYNINKIQLSTGPYIGTALFGKRKFDYVINDGGPDPNKGEEKYKFISKVGPNDLKDNEIAIKGLDFGWDIGVGYMISDILKINAEFGLGLSNLTPEETDDPNFNPADYKTNNRSISVGVSYYFGE